ncbi:sensor histidine kinase [Specibacter sp. NPDC057265]|uniref:sensor histidine kinase n=1 Tax=Specibacter sp. NPDC057265 TaxID=3346075 RepID=UPI003642D46D
MSEILVKQFADSTFYQRSQRTQVTLFQLPLFVTVTTAVLLIAVLEPVLLADPLLIASLVMNMALFAACLLIPWGRFHPAWRLGIPYLDFMVVALFREGGIALFPAAGTLVLFPIFWVCGSGYAPKLAVACGTLVSLFMVSAPQLHASQLSVSALVGTLLFPFMMLCFGTAVVVLTRSLDHNRITMEAKDALLQDALAQSQEREGLLETILDTVGVGVVAVDAEGNELVVNAAQEAQHEVAGPANIMNPQENELLLFGPDQLPLSADGRPVRRALLGETFTDYRIRAGSGPDAKVLSTTARTIRRADGGRGGAVIAFHDVTDMVSALAAKDDFVANVSHEFRTPLTAIQSYLALALETPGLHPQEVMRYLTIADRNADRLGVLVSDLLTSASMTLKRAPHNISQLLQDSLASVAPAAEANGVIVDWQCEDQLMARIDGVRLGQVLDNLISNAVKYSPDGGTLTVRAWADGTDLRCQVSDTGLGMSVSEQAGLFQKFYRAGTARGRGIPGIGLGLMISKTIIDNHGGKIAVKSEKGAGTTMSFVIPACVVGMSLTAN